MERNVRPQRLVEEVFFVGLSGLVIQPCPNAGIEEFISLQNILADRSKFGTFVDVSYKIFCLLDSFSEYEGLTSTHDFLHAVILVLDSGHASIQEFQHPNKYRMGNAVAEFDIHPLPLSLLVYFKSSNFLELGIPGW